MAASTASKATGPICAKLSARWPGTMLLFRLCLVILFCEPLAEARHNDAPYLLVSQERLIWRMGLDGSEARVLVRERNGRVNAVDYHYRLRYVFWLNVMTKSINRAHLEDGSGAIMVVNGLTRPGAEPAGLAVDWMEDTLYWTDQNRHMIEVYNIRTGTEGMVLNTMSLPYGIAVDPMSGWLYWADRERRMIERQNITGTERNRVQSSRLPCTVAITLDQDGDEILWCDLCYFRVERSNTDGSSRRIIARQVYFCYGLAAFQEYVYWTQGSPTALYRTKKHGGGRKEVVANGSSAGRFFGVVVVHPMKQPLPAYYYAGDCEYFHNCSATVSSSVASTPTPSLTSFTTLSITTVLSSSYLRPSPTFHSSQEIISTEGVLSSRGSSASPSPIQPTSVVSSDVASMPTTTSPWLSVSSANPKLHSSTAISSIQPSTLTPTPSVQSTGPDSTSRAPSSRFDSTSSSVAASTKVPSATTAGSSTAFHSLVSSLETATWSSSPTVGPTPVTLRHTLTATSTGALQPSSPLSSLIDLTPVTSRHIPRATSSTFTTATTTATSRHTQRATSSNFTTATSTGALRPSSPLISSTPVTSRHMRRATSSTFTTATTTVTSRQTQTTNRSITSTGALQPSSPLSSLIDLTPVTSKHTQRAASSTFMAATTAATSRLTQTVTSSTTSTGALQPSSPLSSLIDLTPVTSRHMQTATSSTFTTSTTTGALRPSSPLISSTPVTSRHTPRATSSTFTNATTTATSTHTPRATNSTFTTATSTSTSRPSSPPISSTPVTSRHTQRATSSTFTTATATVIASTSVNIKATSDSSGVSKSPPVQGTASESGMEMMMLIIYGSIGSAVVLFALIVIMCCLVCVKVARRSHKRAKRSYTMPVHNCLSLYASPGEVAAKSLYDIPEPVLAARSSPTDSEGSSSSPSVTSPMLRRPLPAIKPQVLDLADLVPGANGIAPTNE